MRAFALDRPKHPADAVSLARQPEAEYLAGGTDMLQLMKDEVRRPQRLVDLEPLDMTAIEAGPDGLWIGASVRMSDAADHHVLARDYPMVAEALLESAAPQLRNLATMGGNLLQRTRCSYFRDVAQPCNKRVPGSGCGAIGGINRIHAILGGSTHCVAVHASDLAVALTALDAKLRILGAAGERTIPLGALHVLPDDHPEVETVLLPGDLITAIIVPPGPWTRRSHYLKVRDRASFEFALVSAAVALELDGRTIRTARVAVGGVGTKPWRLPAVERMLTGAPATTATWEQAGEAAIDGARPLPFNKLKLPLLRATVTRALGTAGGEA